MTEFTINITWEQIAGTVVILSLLGIYVVARAKLKRLNQAGQQKQPKKSGKRKFKKSYDRNYRGQRVYPRRG